MSKRDSARKYVYSDNDYIFLGKIVQAVSGLTLDQYVENISEFEIKLTSSATVNPITREITITQEALGILLETAKAGVDTRTKERELLNEVVRLKTENSDQWYENYQHLEKAISYNVTRKTLKFFLQILNYYNI